MSYASRRLRKLENRLLDDSGLVPHSPEWCAYWLERIERYATGDIVDLRGPIEVFRIWMQQCEDGSDGEFEERLANLEQAAEASKRTK
jgi:hypothetical protein